MSIRYACRKCGKPYSRAEFEQSNFCRHCDSFILRLYSTEICPRKEKEENNNLEPVSRLSSSQDQNYNRVAKNLKQKIEASHDYQVIASDEKTVVSKSFVIEDWVYESDYEQALRLENALTKRFNGKSLDQAIPGKAVENEFGECYCITETHNSRFERILGEESKRSLLRDLKLIPGIGPVREYALRKEGFNSIDTLVAHPNWRSLAKEFIKLVDEKNINKLESWLRRYLPKSHPLAYCLSGFLRDEDFAVIDVETLGLFGRPIILLGLAKVTDSIIQTYQYLVRDISEETSALYSFMTMLRSDSAFISYNGRSFDLPFIRERLAYYGMVSEFEPLFDCVHFDVLHFSRRALKGRTKNCRLESVEQYLGIRRSINIPGALVPEFYDTYQRTKNVGPLVAIVEHNKQDLVSLAQMFCQLHKEWSS